MSAMNCVVDWAALGTWVTGAMAALIAFFAYRFTERTGTRQVAADIRRVRAYRIAAFLELESLRDRASVCAELVGATDLHEADSVGITMRAIASIPPFVPPSWLLESTTLGELPDEEGAAVARAVAAAAEAERARLMIATMCQSLSTTRDENLVTGGGRMLVGALGGFLGLRARAEAAAGLVGDAIGLTLSKPAQVWPEATPPTP
jgi:hypothetical protein